MSHETDRFMLAGDRVIKINPACVHHDFGFPIALTPWDWRTVSANHNSFSASKITRGRLINASNIVVLADTDNPSATPPTRCVWCVTFSVDGGHSFFEEHFGERFLWPFEHVIALDIAQNILKQTLAVHGSVGMGESIFSHDLVRTLQPRQQCSRVPSVDLWGTPVTHLDNYYDRVFAMSVRASMSPRPRSRCATPGQKPVCSRRPLMLEHLNDDVTRLIIDHMITDAVSTPARMRDVYALRRVSKQFKRRVDASVCETLENLEHKIVAVHSQSENNVESIVSLRRQILGIGLTALEVHKMVAPFTFETFLRLRHGKRPVDKPIRRMRRANDERPVVKQKRR
jgi:hypothetical protein